MKKSIKFIILQLFFISQIVFSQTINVITKSGTSSYKISDIDSINFFSASIVSGQTMNIFTKTGTAPFKISDIDSVNFFSSSIVSGLIINIYHKSGTSSFKLSALDSINFFSAPTIQPPGLTTSSVTNITYTTATSGGNITSDGGDSVITRGVCWSITSNPVISNNKTVDGIGTGSFTSKITGLQPNTNYYVRAYATNSIGTSYGNEMTFKTIAIQFPTLTTTAVTSITSTTAISGGSISSDGGDSVTAKGVCWSTLTNPTIADNKTSDGKGTGSFTSSLTGLVSGTLYYVRSYATNSVGTAYGTQVSFSTSASLPTLTTTFATNITFSSATSGGNITSDGGATVTARGVCWSTSQNPTTANNKTSDGTGIGSFTSSLTNLLPDTLYYLRAYAKNSIGTSYGTQILFKTLKDEIVQDLDGNVYHTVTVGTQIWMVENLKTTKYRNGDAIPNVTDYIYPTTGAYCNYINDQSYSSTYGRLYNWYAVNDVRKIAPVGWHVPTDAEWTALTNYLGGEGVAGGKLKESGTSHWKSLNTGATNETGFTALPGGFLIAFGGFGKIGGEGDWWSSSESSTSIAWYRYMGSSYNNVVRYSDDKRSSFSVRCVKGEIVQLPTISTAATTSITSTTAISGGNISSDGGASITARGVCWSTSANPTTANSKTSDGIGAGSFTSNITGLSANTTYYVRAYATNSVGLVYGSQITFTTSASLPTLTTTAVTNITSTTASSGGSISSDGGASVAMRGVCWSTSANPTTANSKTSGGIGTGSFTSNITGLSANTTYYVRAYATNNVGTAYGTQVSFTTLQEMITDIDGNVYHTVTIGTQVWIVENLKTTKYRNGDAIPNVINDNSWYSLTTGAYSNYNHNSSNTSTYGRLYNWYAVNDSRNIAPTGWHVATDAEWMTLINYLGGEDVAGGKLKETGTTHWQSPNTTATNETGFTALPGGYRSSNGIFSYIGSFGYWWSSTESSFSHAWVRYMYDDNRSMYRHDNGKTTGMSVRCIKDGSTGQVPTLPTLTTTIVTNITSTTASSGGSISSDGGASVAMRGVCWSTSANPTTANSKTSDGIGAGSFTSNITGLSANTTYYVRAYATNNVGTAYGTQVSFTTTTLQEMITDIDGNVYHTVTIGTQVWIVENLKTTKYRNGDTIPNVINDNSWYSLTTGAYSNYNHNSSNTSTYGRLYNWYAVNDSRNIAPTGWHVATDAEWMTLINYLGGEDVAGGKLKETGTTHWQSPNTTATNETGFTALPGGYRSSNGIFSYIGSFGYWWSSTESSFSHAWVRYMYDDNRSMYRHDNGKTTGMSVRCIKDGSTGQVPTLPTLTTTIVTNITSTTASSGGSISSDGGASVAMRGVCWSTSANPTTANSKTSDGIGAGSFTSNITGLSANTTYYVRAYATNNVGTAYGTQVSFTTTTLQEMITDIDGNVYHTVTIGTQVWIVENLKTTKYRNGDTIPNVINDNSWYSLTTGAYSNYNHNSSNTSTYGRLYNWYAVNDSRNIAPTGWHVATDAEWMTLINYLGGEDVAGGKLKETGTTHWQSPNTTATNETGFTALPGGYRSSNGIFSYIGSFGYWWSSTESSFSHAWVRYMYDDNRSMYRHDNGKTTGMSVRCIKD